MYIPQIFSYIFLGETIGALDGKYKQKQIIVFYFVKSSDNNTIIYMGVQVLIFPAHKTVFTIKILKNKTLKMQTVILLITEAFGFYNVPIQKSR